VVVEVDVVEVVVVEVVVVDAVVMEVEVETLVSTEVSISASTSPELVEVIVVKVSGASDVVVGSEDKGAAGVVMEFSILVSLSMSSEGSLE